MKYKLPEYTLDEKFTLIEKFILVEDGEALRNEIIAKLNTIENDLNDLKNGDSTDLNKLQTELKAYENAYKSNPDNEAALRTIATKICGHLVTIANHYEDRDKAQIIKLKDNIEDAKNLDKQDQLNGYIEKCARLIPKDLQNINSSDINKYEKDLKLIKKTVENTGKLKLREPELQNLAGALKYYNSIKNINILSEIINEFANVDEETGKVKSKSLNKLDDKSIATKKLEQLIKIKRADEINWSAYKNRVDFEYLCRLFIKSVFGEHADAIINLGDVLREELSEFGVSVQNQFIVFLTKVINNKDNKIIPDEGHYIEIHNAYANSYITAKDLRGEGKLGTNNIIFNKVWKLNINAIEKWLKLQKKYIDNSDKCDKAGINFTDLFNSSNSSIETIEKKYTEIGIDLDDEQQNDLDDSDINTICAIIQSRFASNRESQQFTLLGLLYNIIEKNIKAIDRAIVWDSCIKKLADDKGIVGAGSINLGIDKLGYTEWAELFKHNITDNEDNRIQYAKTKQSTIGNQAIKNASEVCSKLASAAKNTIFSVGD